MSLSQVRPSTPNMVLYDEDLANGVEVTNTMIGGKTGSRPGTTGSLAPPPPMQYHSPPDSMLKDTGTAGTAPGIWTIEGEKVRILLIPLFFNTETEFHLI